MQKIKRRAKPSQARPLELAVSCTGGMLLVRWLLPVLLGLLASATAVNVLLLDNVSVSGTSRQEAATSSAYHISAR